MDVHQPYYASMVPAIIYRIEIKNLLRIYSVNDYIQLLTDLKKIKINENWYFGEITNQTQKMIGKLGLSVDGNNT